MKINFSFSKLLNNDKFIKVLSVLLAIVAWIIVSITVDTNQITVIDGIPLTIDTTNTALNTLGLSIVDGEEQTVSVKVEGIGYRIGNLTKDDFIATPRLSSVTNAGEQEVKIEVRKVDSTDTDYKIVNYTTSLKLNFDRLSSKTLPIQALADNVTAAEGYNKEAVTATPAEIILSGPQTQVNKIYKCVVRYDEEEVLDDTKVVEGSIHFYDSANNELSAEQIDKVTYDKQKFELTISIFRHKTVPIRVTFANVPQGLDPNNLVYTLSVDELTIAGPKDIVDKREDVTVGPIDFSKITIGKVFDLEINLESAESNVENITTVQLTIESDGLDEKRVSVSNSNITMKNKPAGYDVELRTELISNVRIVGNRTDIEAISSKDVIAILDLRDIDENTWRVSVSFYVTGNKFAWATGDYYANIKVTKE